MGRVCLGAVWPKQHPFTVQECRALDVRDVLVDFPPRYRATERGWRPPNYPELVLVPHRGGPFKRWWFRCPRCERRCETLFIPPNVQREDWRCRKCYGLVYVSQRFGKRHPLRRRLTRRQEVSRRKKQARLAREYAEVGRERQEYFAKERQGYAARERDRAGASVDGVLTASNLHARTIKRDDDDVEICLAPDSDSCPDCRRARVREMLQAQLAATRARVREIARTAPRKRDRERATQILERLGAEQAVARKATTLSEDKSYSQLPISSLRRADIEEMNRVFREKRDEEGHRAPYRTAP